MSGLLAEIKGCSYKLLWIVKKTCQNTL